MLSRMRFFCSSSVVRAWRSYCVMVSSVSLICLNLSSADFLRLSRSSSERVWLLASREQRLVIVLGLLPIVEHGLVLFFNVGGPILEGASACFGFPVVVEHFAQINGANATLAPRRSRSSGKPAAAPEQFCVTDFSL